MALRTILGCVVFYCGFDHQTAEKHILLKDQLLGVLHWDSQIYLRNGG